MYKRSGLAKKMHNLTQKTFSGTKKHQEMCSDFTFNCLFKMNLGIGHFSWQKTWKLREESSWQLAMNWPYLHFSVQSALIYPNIGYCIHLDYVIINIFKLPLLRILMVMSKICNIFKMPLYRLLPILLFCCCCCFRFYFLCFFHAQQQCVAGFG